MEINWGQWVMSDTQKASVGADRMNVVWKEQDIINGHILLAGGSGAGHSTSGGPVVGTGVGGALTSADTGGPDGGAATLTGGAGWGFAAWMDACFSAAADSAACCASLFALNLSAIKSALASNFSVSKSSPRKTAIIASSTKSIAKSVNSRLERQRLM